MESDVGEVQVAGGDGNVSVLSTLASCYFLPLSSVLAYFLTGIF